MEDDLNHFFEKLEWRPQKKMKDDLTKLLEDDLKNKNGRQPKTKMEEDLKNKTKWKTT